MEYLKKLFRKKPKFELKVGQVYKLRDDVLPNPGPWEVPDCMVKILDLKDDWVRYDYLPPYDKDVKNLDCRVPIYYFCAMILYPPVVELTQDKCYDRVLYEKNTRDRMSELEQDISNQFG